MAKRIPFTDQVRRAVASCGMTRYRIWKETGIDQGTLSKFVSGKVGLSVEAMDRLAELLELNVATPKAAKPKAKATKTQGRKGR